MTERKTLPRLLLRIGAVLVVGGIFGLLAWLGISLTRGDGRIAVVWLPNAFLIAVLMRGGDKLGWSFVLSALFGNISANLLSGDALATACSLALINSLEICMVWIIMRRLGIPRPDMDNLRDLFAFSGVGGILAPVIAGLLAAAFLGGSSWEAALQVLLKWAISDGLGVLLLSPTMMIFYDAWVRWKNSDPDHHQSSGTVNSIQWIAILSLGLTISLLVFGQNLAPALFLIAPVVLLHAFRLGSLGTAICTLQIAIIGTIFTAREMGPVHLFEASVQAQLITLQLFLFCCFCVGLPVSAALAAKDKIREALKESMTRSKLIAQAAPIGMFQANAEGKLIYVNEGVCDMMDMSQEYLIENGTMASFGDPAPWDDQLLGRKTEYSGHPRKLQIPYTDSDGNITWLETLDVPELGKKGNIKDYTGVVIDITESKELEENLISARRHAEAAADSKSRFLANMSHEIRTPMNGVLGFTQLLLDSELTDEQRQQTEMILDSGNAMMRLLNDILDISKIEAGQAKVNLEPVDIAHVLNSCVKLMAPTAEHKGISLKTDIQDSVPDFIVGDHHYLRQIVLNLLGNAVKFTEQGGITLAASTDIGPDEAQWISIEVQDTGIGISPERQQAIFAPFEQAENDTAEQFGGSGLGLTISQQLAALMEGDLSVSSTPGEGTTFTLRFPAQLPEDESKTESEDMDMENEDMDIELLSKPLPENNQEMCDRPKAHLLLVEDHDINQILISAMTERLGYETTLAIDGADAVAKIDAAAQAGNPFDLVLMDVQMPVMDGFQATRMIRTSGITPESLPIIAITANAFSDDIEGCLAAGMQAHIAKPVMIDKLKAILETWIPSGDPEPDISPNPPLLNGDLGDKYRERKDEVLLCLTSLVRAATYTEDELREAAEHLHKLAGTAALFGEEDLGIKAKMIENGIRQWKVEDRPKQLLVAVSDFLRAA